MQYYCDTLERERFLEESILEMESVSKKIAKLTLRRDELIKDIIGVLGHEHEGQKSYDYQIWKIEVKTPCVYTLDKKNYESGKYPIPEQYNPIKKSTSYTIDKRLCDEYMQTAPKEIRESLLTLIDKKPGKANVSIKERLS